MKKMVLLLSCVGFLASCQTPPGPRDGKKPPVILPSDPLLGEAEMGFPKTVEEYLGAVTIQHINAAIEGESFTVESKRGESRFNVAGFAFIAMGKKLTSEQLDTIKKVLLDPATYIFPTAKKVMIAPKIGIRLKTSEGKELNILFDQTNLLLAVPGEGKLRVEDYDPAKFLIQNLLKDL